MKERLLVWSGGIVVAVAVVGFVVFIAVEGLNKAAELAGVVGALVALSGLALTVAGLVVAHRHVEPPTFVEPPIIVEPLGPAPWVLKGYGYRYSVNKITHGTSNWMHETKPSITIAADVTRTTKSDYHHLEYEFRDQDSGRVLKEVPFESEHDPDLSLDQRTPVKKVFFDLNPPISTLTITLHDFYWADGKDLILKDVPVPPRPVKPRPHRA